jgi:CheY-like chemotaxis protein
MSELRVLVVDDTNFFQEMAKWYLRQSAVTVFTAGNGREALTVARKTLPHLIFLDLHLQEMDGAACCAALKADPLLRTIPVVMVVTPTGEGDREGCGAAGCDDLLVKPVERKAFLNACRTHLSAVERRERRIPCRATVMCRSLDATFYGTIEDISETGMFVGSRHGVRLNDRITLSFLIPGRGETVIDTTARVVWVNGKRGRISPKLAPGFGVEFLEISDEAREIIGNFITHGILRHQIPDDELLERPGT